MPQFFFNYREREDCFKDESGVEFDSFEMAYVDAFRAASEMWPELMARRVDPCTCGFDMFDSKGNLLAVLNFKELLENCRAPSAPRKMQKTSSDLRDLADATRRHFAECQEEFVRVQSRLSVLKQLVSMDC